MSGSPGNAPKACYHLSQALDTHAQFIAADRQKPMSAHESLGAVSWKL